MNNRDRKPIMINNTAIAKIDIFKATKGDLLNLSWRFWEDEKDIDNFPDWEKMAKEFISQLQDEWCIGFIGALQKEFRKIIKYHKEVCEEIKIGDINVK